EPVFGREGVDRQRLDPEVDRSLDRPAESTRPFAMPRLDRKRATLGPASIPIEDDRHRARNLARLGPRLRTSKDSPEKLLHAERVILRPRAAVERLESGQQREADQKRLD